MAQYYNPDLGIYYEPAAGYTPPSTHILQQPAGQPSSAVPVTNLQSETAIQVPTPVPQADAVAPTVASATQATKSIQDYIKEMTPTETEISKQLDEALGNYSSLIPGLTGRGEEQLKAEQDAGLPQLKQSLAALNAQILASTAEATRADVSYNQLSQKLEGQAIPMNLIIGQQAQVEKMRLAEGNARAADLNLLQARALGLQGQVQAAQSYVDRAIDLKYQDRQATLDAKMAQLDLLGKMREQELVTFDKAQQRQYEDLLRKYDEDQRRIEEEKAKAKENINLAFSANIQTKFVNKGGEFFRVSDGKSYSSPEEFFKDAGVTSFDQAYQRGMITDLTAEKVADLEYVSQLRAKYSDAGIALSDSAVVAEQKVQNNSRIYREEVRPPQYTTGSGSVTSGIIDSATDARVAQIIASNPGEYGNAADQIDREFGQGTATTYDNWLRRVYLYGQNINDVMSNKTPTDSQRTASAYANRTIESNSIISQMQNTISEYDKAGFATQMSGTAARFNTRSENIQKYDQAARNFINAILRRESGAVISEEEFNNAYLQYLPRPGDTSDVLKQKEQNRNTAILGLTSAAGNAFQIPAATQQAQTTIMIAPDGSKWEVPINQVETFKQNGYKQI